MSTLHRYTLPVEQSERTFDGQTETCFTGTTTIPGSVAGALRQGQEQQWDAAERIDCSLDLDPENPTSSTTG